MSQFSRRLRLNRYPATAASFTCDARMLPLAWISPHLFTDRNAAGLLLGLDAKVHICLSIHPNVPRVATWDGLAEVLQSTLCQLY